MNGQANALAKSKNEHPRPQRNTSLPRLCCFISCKSLYRLLTVTAFLLLTGVFKVTAQTNIVICIKSQKLPSDCNAMAEHVAWNVKWSKTQSVDELKKELATKMNARTDDDTKKLIYASSNKQYACILSFTVKERFTDCKRTLYAYGFGNSEAEAMEEASAQVQLYTLNDFLVDNHYEVSSKINTAQPYE